jgi:ATP-dependent DNA helicase PIF1
MSSDSMQSSTRPQLSPEIMARIEMNRAAALAKRKRIVEAEALNAKRTSPWNGDPPPDVRVVRPSPGMSYIQSEFRDVHTSSFESSSSTPSIPPSSARPDELHNHTEGPVLSEEQEYVWREAMSGRSIFLTGCGGTGKSFLTNNLITSLKEKYGKAAVAITATTGIAACQIGGTSLHNFAGIGLGNGSIDDLVDRVSKNKRVCDRWKKTKCLIIDEISMLDGELFDKIEALARAIRKDERPFGGIQLLLVGDFLQLPPIKKNGNVSFCFEAGKWNRAVELNLELRTVFRQNNSEFVDMLNSIRRGVCTPETAKILTATKNNMLNESNGVQATRLYATNADVDRINNQKLDQLSGEMICLVADDSGEQPFLEQLDKNCLAPQKLCIKPGAQVMLLKNLDTEGGLTNGTRGVVDCMVETEEEGLVPRVLFETKNGLCSKVMTKETFSLESFGKVVASRSQYPLRLAYAITIHKCQGMTLNKVELSLGNVFEYGQSYVALSRVSSLEGLRLLDFNPSVVKAHPRVLEFYRTMQQPTSAAGGSFSKRDRLLPHLPHSAAASAIEQRKNPFFCYDD